MGITASLIKELRERTGAGMMECKKAIELCAGDSLLAEGYLKYQGLAVCIRAPGKTDEEAYRDWVWANARRYAEERRA